MECVWDSATVAETGEKALALVREIGYFEQGGQRPEEILAPLKERYFWRVG
jgi:hypothetical protein